MTIDIHPHVISTDTDALSERAGRRSQIGLVARKTRERGADDRAPWIRRALRNRLWCRLPLVTATIIRMLPMPSPPTQNRFTGVFSVDVLAPDAPEKIRYWVGRKLTGMRLFTAGSTMPNQADWVDDPRSFPAWECASELRIPVCMQMTVKAIPQLIRMLERFPKVPVILDHLAKPTLSDGPPYTGADRCLSTGGLQEPVLETDPAHRRGSAKREGHSRDLFPAARIEIRSFADRLGIELSGI